MKKTLLFLMGLVVLLSCERGKDPSVYARLDSALKQRMTYVDRYSAECGLLNGRLSTAPTDSERWVIADSLFWRSAHYSLDSLIKYNNLQLSLQDVTPRQRFLTAVNRIHYLVVDEQEPFADFAALDTTLMTTREDTLRYLKCGAMLFHKIKNPALTTQENLRLETSFAQRYISRDPTSLLAIKLRAQLLAAKGDYKAALETLLPYQSLGYADIDNQEALVQCYIGIMYRHMGLNEEAKEWFARSAVLDFQYPSRGYTSLYYLAQILFEENDLERANRYITTTFDDMITGGFNRKIIHSAQLGFMVSSAIKRAEKRKRETMTGMLVLLAVTISALLCLMLVLRSNVVKLNTTRRELERSNQSLRESNTVMNSYVYRYMEMSLQYLDRIEADRHNLRRLYKTDTDAFQKALQSPSEMYSELRNFYATFDKIFLGIYPDFIEKTNTLFPESDRFTVQAGEALPTEVRILAAIKLGITDSRKIAEFLRCSISTVYNYRARMRKAALCPKDEFESLIRRIS